MRPLVRSAAPALVLGIGLLLAACGGGSDSSSAAPGTAAPPTPVDGQVQPQVLITAVNIAFQPTEVTVAAGSPFTIGFDNRDAEVPHDLVITSPSGEIVAKTEIVTGPAHVELAVPALAAGTYPFSCEVHPNMTGTLTAE
jgi:plastocyanin